MTTTRPFGVGDHDDWLKLFRGYLAFYDSVASEMMAELTFSRLVRSDVDLHGALVRDARGRAAGLIHWTTQLTVRTEASHCFLDGLFVLPESRGSGAGSLLIGHVRNWARAQGCARVAWISQATDPGARALYDRVADGSAHTLFEIWLPPV